MPGPRSETGHSVIVDDREPLRAIKVLRAGDPALRIERRRLDRGDYRWNGDLLFERKSAPDFAASLIDGRLFRQTARLARAARAVALVLEGSLDGCGVPRHALLGTWTTICLVHGVPILRTVDLEETIRAMRYAADQHRRHGVVRRPVGPTSGGAEAKRRLQMHLLQGLPGVGPDRAERLLAHFGGVAGIVAASEQELTSVAGIGRRTARRIRRAVSEPPGVYAA